MKFVIRYFPIILGATFALGIVMGSFISSPINNNGYSNNFSKNKINNLIDYITTEYVDKVDLDSIVNRTVNDILAKLDPHSVYMTPSEQSRMAESMRGEFVGIGINFYLYKDTVTVIKTVEDGPSAKAGIKGGDRILFANKTRLFGRKLLTDSLFAHFKGDLNSKVQLTIYRPSEKKQYKLTVTRNKIPLKSVDVVVMLKDKLGYIKINRFAESTYEEFLQGIAFLKTKKCNGLVIDLRDNGGGYMEQAVAIADELLADKKIIVFTKSKDKITSKMFATSKGSFEKGRVFILVNENSASASEILAGAIQDNDRGTIIGRRTFGKGLVQREMDFQDGSAVRLTVARYYTPTGRSIQKEYYSGVDQYRKEADLRQFTGELITKDSIKVNASQKFKTPKGRIVYGGGGIVPDVFVPLEVDHGHESIVELTNSGIIGRFVFEQLDKNRSELAKMTYDQFLKNDSFLRQYYDLFKNYLLEIGIDIKADKDIVLINKTIQAEIARQLFDDSKYHEIMLRDDAMVKAAIDRF